MSAISGKSTLHRLIYSSRQRIDPADVDHEVGTIIRTAIARNREQSLTGLLLVHEGWFVQALEGPTERVMTTYRRILNDPRHEDAKVLGAGPAAQREFGDWNMCARRMSEADDAILSTLKLRGPFKPDAFSARSALTLLKAVRGVQERTQLGTMV